MISLAEAVVNFRLRGSDGGFWSSDEPLEDEQVSESLKAVFDAIGLVYKDDAKFENGCLVYDCEKY